MGQLLKNRVFKNASWVIGCKIGQMIINLVVGMLTARYLGPSNYGVINYSASIVAFVTPIMQLGMNSILVQEIVNSPEKEGETLGTAITMCVCSSFLCIIGVIAFAKIANAGEHETIIVCLLYSFVLVFQAFEMIVYWFQAKLMSKYTSIMMFAAYVVVAAYKIYLLATEKSVYWFAASQAIDFALIAFGSIIIYEKLGKQRLSFSKSAAKRLFSKSHFYIVSAMMVTIFAQTDKIMIKLMLNNEETGYYSAAITIAALSSFVFTAIVDSMRPVIFESRKQSMAKYEERLSLLYSMVIYLSLAQCLVMTILANLIIRILYGLQYMPSVSALQIGVWYTTFSYLGMVRNIWILAENQQKYLWKINLSGALSNVALNFMLIPVMGINGAALASLITQFFTNIIVGYIIKPIRKNNAIMLRGINPKLMLSMIYNKKQKQRD